MESFVNWIIAGGSIATAFTVGILAWSVLNQRKQLLVSNFEVITNYIGSEKTRYARRILMKHYDSEISKEFFKKFSKETSQEFDEYNEWVKYIGSIYNRVGFLLQQDKKLRNKIIDYHGFTIGIMWIMFKPFMEMWQEEDKIKEYSEFKEIGDLCFCEWKDDVKKFLAKKSEQNSQKDKFEWLFTDRKSPIEW